MSESLQLSKKVVLLGDTGVGKTSMIRKFVYDVFEDKYISTLGTKVSSKLIIINHPTKDILIEMKFMIWDLMGEKEYQMFQQSAYMGAQGALIVCDVTRRETLNELPNWIRNLFDVTGEIPIILVGNKNDLSTQKQIEHDDLKEIAGTFEVPAFLSSAKTGENVENAFKILGENIVKFECSTLE